MGSKPRPPYYESDVQPTASRRPLNNCICNGSVCIRLRPRSGQRYGRHPTHRHEKKLKLDQSANKQMYMVVIDMSCVILAHAVPLGQCSVLYEGELTAGETANVVSYMKVS